MLVLRKRHEEKKALLGQGTLRACVKVPAGKRSYSYTPTEDRSSLLVGEVVLFGQAHSIGRDAHGSVREEGETRLASQISRINPGDGWGDRCRSQIALTSRAGDLKTQFTIKSSGGNYITSTQGVRSHNGK